MGNLFFDIETHKTTRTDYKDRVAQNIKPPGNIKKAETILAWEVNDKPSLIDEKVEKSSLNGGLCHIVQIQFSVDRDDTIVMQAESTSDEVKLITGFFEFISDHVISRYVGHNIFAFDLRVLYQRAAVLGIIAPGSLTDAFNSKRWDKLVFDTAIKWAGDRDYVSMDDLCYYLGVPTPKGEITGANFGDFYRGGELEKCKEYGYMEIEALRAVYGKLSLIN